MGSYEEVLSLLTPKLASALSKADLEIKNTAGEIRLRSGKPISITLRGKNIFIDEYGKRVSEEKGIISTSDDISEVFSSVCRHCIYSIEEQLRQGFVTAAGGHRVGICGTAAYKNGDIVSVKNISGLNIRIAHRVHGCADKIYSSVFEKGLSNVIIASPPAGGKTTVLREIARKASENGKRVCVIDERGEIAGTDIHGSLGALCDVLDGFPKAVGITYAVRALSPQLIICDEIGARDDGFAISEAFRSGVPLIMTLHASEFEEISGGRLSGELLKEGLVKNVVLLCGEDAPGQIKHIYRRKADGSFD